MVRSHGDDSMRERRADCGTGNESPTDDPKRGIGDGFWKAPTVDHPDQGRRILSELSMKFPNKLVCGDEGLGVGGLVAGWWTWPVLMRSLSGCGVLPTRLCDSVYVAAGYASPCLPLQHVDMNLVGICELP
jgi:hypothetical protein